MGGALSVQINNMGNNKDDDLTKYQINPNDPQLKAAYVPARIRKRRERFIQVPIRWMERLGKAPLASGAVHQVALHLLYLNWKHGGKPFKLPNGELHYDGVNRQAKWRALAILERRGLITVERRRKKSPIIEVHLAD
jgi:hypothetical protein